MSKNIKKNRKRRQSFRFRRCEICGLRSGRKSEEDHVFMAQFPMNESRCKQWIKACGNEDLVYLPIEKLHVLKQVCGNHFKPNDFNWKGTRLRRSAIPSLNLRQKPLSEEILQDFPLRIAKNYMKPDKYELNIEHNYCRNQETSTIIKRAGFLMEDSVKEILHKFPHPQKDPERFRTWLYNVGGDVLALDNNTIFKSRRVCHLHFEIRYHTRSKFLSPDAIPQLCLPETMEYQRSNDHAYSRIYEKYHNDHTYVKLKVESLNFSRNDQESNGNLAELKAPLLNNETDAAGTGESNVNEKTEVDLKKSRIESHPYAEGIPDFYDDDDQEPTVQNLQGSKAAQDPVFSWEKTVEEVPADEGDAVVCLEEKEAEDLPTEISLYCDDDSSPANLDSDKAPEYQCNECREIITGFRYTCVQCADWDLCGACEARAAHDTHYVLRVPGQRPYSEIQAVLAAIRQQILTENLFLNPIDDSLKMEIKSESDEAPPGPENGPPPDLDSLPDLELLPDLDPLPVPDPLGEERLDSENSYSDSSEESDSDVDSPPSRAGTPDEPSTQTDHPDTQTISSDDTDATLSPRRKRMRILKKTNAEATRIQPVIAQEIQPGPSNRETHTYSQTTKYRQLTKIYAHQIPQQILAKQISVTSEPHAQRARPVTLLETPRFNQKLMRYRQPVKIPNPTSLLIQTQGGIEEPTDVHQKPRTVLPHKEPTESVHQKPRTVLPRILKRGRPIKYVSENVLRSSQDLIQRTDHERQTVEASESTELQAEQLNEQPEFCLRLPAGTNEESLIQALQSKVTVRLKRDF